jgi:hypothetical protein
MSHGDVHPFVITNYQVINIGTGKPISIKSLAETLTKLYDKPGLFEKALKELKEKHLAN